MSVQQAGIKPRRVLVVEDESLIALLIADQLGELGHIVVGPVFSSTEARYLAAAAPIDLAILDLNLRGVFVDEVADLLISRKIPFLFTTGFAGHPDKRFANIELLTKPFLISDLERVIARIVQVGEAKPRNTTPVTAPESSALAAK